MRTLFVTEMHALNCFISPISNFSNLTHICLVDLSILINCTSPFFILRSVWCTFSFFKLMLIETPVCKQRRAWSDAAFWSGSALFVMSLLWDVRLIRVNKYACKYMYHNPFAPSNYSSFHLDGLICHLRGVSIDLYRNEQEFMCFNEKQI